MARATFPYVAIPLPANEAHPQGTVAYRPLVIATVTASTGESLQFTVLPDSGVDACLFPLSLALLLKIDVLKLPRALTAGLGSQANVTYFDTLAIDLGNGIAFSAYVGFTLGMDQVGLGLLGQTGFFEHFEVEFLHRQKTFTIQSV
jgi:hypothetical protein